MAKITLSAQAGVVVDGEVSSMRASWTVDVNDVSEQTRGIDTTYIQLKQDNFLFIAIANIGAEDAVLRVSVGANYLRFKVPASGHLLIPGSGMLAGTLVPFVDPSIRTIANTSRIKVIIGSE